MEDGEPSSIEAESAAELALAWRDLERDPDALEPKRRVAKLLQRNPRLARPADRPSLLRLVCDPDVDPALVAAAGWCLVADDGLFANDEPLALARRLEGDELALRLLEESPVPSLSAEAALTRLRRALLVSGGWRTFVRLARALARQAALNGGAWWVDAEERAALALAPGFEPAYFPSLGARSPDPDVGDRVTEAVGWQYRYWPYPTWSRILAPSPPRPPPFRTICG